MTRLTHLQIATLGVALSIGVIEVARTQQPSAPGGPSVAWSPKLPSAKDGNIQILPVRGGVSMLVGGGANITVFTGHEGILMVDTGTKATAEKVFAAVRTLSSRPLRYIVNTTHHLDHVGGNEIIAPKGEMVPFRLPDTGGGGARVGGQLPTDRASVVSSVATLGRMSAPTGKVAPTPESAWPDNTYSTALKKLNFNDEPVVIMHMPGNNDGNTVVHFRLPDVLSIGDLVDLTAFPRIEVDAGGDVSTYLKSLNKVIDLTVPTKKSEGGTMVITGHGRIADIADITYYRDMVTIVRDRVKDMHGRGMSLGDIQAARPSREYDPRFSKTKADAEAFVESVYRGVVSQSGETAQ